MKEILAGERIWNRYDRHGVKPGKIGVKLGYQAQLPAFAQTPRAFAAKAGRTFESVPVLYAVYGEILNRRQSDSSN